MGERSMRECVEYHLLFCREHLASCNTTPQDFYDGGQDWESLDDHCLPREALESLAHSWGYLEGAADIADLTIAEMLDVLGLSFNKPARKHKRARGARWVP